MGRKRFLSKIKFGNRKEKAKAQRQAVNSICQAMNTLLLLLLLLLPQMVISTDVKILHDCVTGLCC